MAEKLTDGQLRERLEACAQAEHVHPRELTLRQARQQGFFVPHNRGWVELIDQLFPPEPSPFARYKGLNLDDPDVLEEYEVSKHIYSTIGECAKHIKVTISDLTWYEFRRYIKFRYGENDQGIARYAITKCGGYNVIRDAYYRPRPTKVKKERQRLTEVAQMNRKLGREDTEREFILDRVEEYCSRVFKKAFSIQVCCREVPNLDNLEFLRQLVLSDLHFGSDIRAEETGYQNFGPVEERRRFASIIRQTCEWRPEHRSKSRLKVLVLGDVVQGILHDLRDGAAYGEQINRAIDCLVQGLTYLCVHFPESEVIFTPGNHDRFTERHKKRATTQKWDSVLFVVARAVFYALKSNDATKHVKITFPLTPYATYDVFGQPVFVTHGDTTLDVGYTSSSLDVKKIESQVNRLNNRLPDQDKYRMVICGHVHLGTVMPMNNRTMLVVNPSIVPPDQYAVSIGIHESWAGQWLLESRPDRIVADFTLLEVGPSQDQDESLDQIIDGRMVF